jgi:guanosine-3',5'-bis(diphosphate) 3'-pyrophosphohydrolase
MYRDARKIARARLPLAASRSLNAPREREAASGKSGDTPMDAKLLEAVAFAARAHQGQLRKDRATPYVSHVFRVCLVVRDLFGFDDPRMLITALLHDTIEDTTTDFDDIEKRFGAEIAGWVSYLTKDKRLPEHERERAYLDRLKESPWQVQVCKLADIFDNLMDMPNLPADRRAHALQRAEQYFAELRHIDAPEAHKAIALVAQLLAELRA